MSSIFWSLYFSGKESLDIVLLDKFLVSVQPPFTKIGELLNLFCFKVYVIFSKISSSIIISIIPIIDFI